MTTRLSAFDWLPLAFGGAALLIALAVYWGASAEGLNRALIVTAGVAMLLRCRAVRPGSDQDGAARTAGLALLVLSLLACPPAWFLVMQAGPRPVLLWWLALGWLAAAAGHVLVLGGLPALRAGAFPLLFLLFALPIPQRIEAPVQDLLQRGTTTLAAALLPALGFSCQRHGYVLSLPGGELGVMEACSGFRSLSALTAVAALVAYLRRFDLLRGCGLVLATLPLIVLINAGRITLSALLQERVGAAAIRGTAHELLGLTAVLLILAAIGGLSQLLRSAGEMSKPGISADLVFQKTNSRNSRLNFSFSLLTVVFCVAASALGWRLTDQQLRAAPLEDISLQLDSWHGEESPIPDEVSAALTCDRAIHRVYRNGIGQEIQVWVIFWSGAGSVRGYHHPDVCWPSRGWTISEQRTQTLGLGAGGLLPVAVRQFRSGDRRQMICYWTQEGRRVWNDADEDAAHVEGTPGHRWIRERLTGQAPQRTGRLAVLVGTDLWGSGGYAEQSLLEFSRAFAGEMYRVIPWAAPE